MDSAFDVKSKDSDCLQILKIFSCFFFLQVLQCYVLHLNQFYILSNFHRSCENQVKILFPSACGYIIFQNYLLKGYISSTKLLLHFVRSQRGMFVWGEQNKHCQTQMAFMNSPLHFMVLVTFDFVIEVQKSVKKHLQPYC